ARGNPGEGAAVGREVANDIALQPFVQKEYGVRIASLESSKVTRARHGCVKDDAVAGVGQPPLADVGDRLARGPFGLAGLDASDGSALQVGAGGDGYAEDRIDPGGVGFRFDDSEIRDPPVVDAAVRQDRKKAIRGRI